jgi:hypothetical protein
MIFARSREVIKDAYQSPMFSGSMTPPQSADCSRLPDELQSADQSGGEPTARSGNQL